MGITIKKNRSLSELFEFLNNQIISTDWSIEVSGIHFDPKCPIPYQNMDLKLQVFIKDKMVQELLDDFFKPDEIN